MSDAERPDFNKAEVTEEVLLAQLAQAHKELSEADAELVELWSKIETIINDRTKSLTKERDEAVAACAVILHAINVSNVGDWIDIPPSDCGKSFLERMQEAEWLLSQPLLPKMFNQSELTEYRRRYHAFLKGGK